MSGKKVTIKDVAEKANVSKATVSYVLNNRDKVSEETRQKVLQAMKELDYVPSSTARNLAKQQEDTFKNKVINENPFYLEFLESYVGMQVGKEPLEIKKQILSSIENSGVIPSLLMKQFKKKIQLTIGIILSLEGDDKVSIFHHNPFYQELINGAEEEARKRNAFLKIMYADEIEQNIGQGNNPIFTGFIIVGKVSQSVLDYLDTFSIPIVHVDDYCNRSNHMYVLSNDKEAAFQCVEYLIKQGYKKIGFVGGISDYCSVYQNRYDGYKEALFHYDLDFHKKHVFITPGHGYEHGIEITKQIIREKNDLDAIFCISDITTIGIMKGLHQHNLEIPKEIGIMGFDNIQASQYCYPELTTANQSIIKKGQLAVHLIVNTLNGVEENKMNIIPIEIVERESIIKK